jgi:hypothetical protein
MGYVAKLADMALDTDELVSALGYDDEYVVIDAAMKCLRKEGTSTTDLERDRAEVLAQIVEDAQSQESDDAVVIRNVRADSTQLWDFLWDRHCTTGDDY